MYGYRKERKIFNYILLHRHMMLFYGLLSLIVFPAFFYKSLWENLANLFSNAVVIFFGVFCIVKNKKQLYIGLVNGLLVILINKLGIWRSHMTINFYLSFVVYILFYIYLAISMFRMILRSKKVNEGVLFGAVNVYLLAGIIGAYLFMLIEMSFPGSISNLALENIGNPTKFIYFSFVTLSTLGYGDLLPLSTPAQTLAIILSTFGPLYLTIIVAMLVSRYDQQKAAES